MGIETFWELAANQGFSIVLLGVAVRYFYLRQKEWEKKIEDLHLRRDVEREQLIKLTEELQTVIQHNTEILQAIKIMITDCNKSK